MHKFSRSSIHINSVIPRVAVPLYAVASAGEPLAELNLEKIGSVMVRADFYEPAYIYVRVQGHSMDNGSFQSIRDGDTAVIDPTDRTARLGRIYMWQIPSVGPCLKRFDGGVLASLNPEHKPFRPEDGTRPSGRLVGILLSDGRIDPR